jgi:glucokinase
VALCLAVDIGGTKLAAGLVTVEGVVRAARRVPTPDAADPDVLFDALAALVTDVGGDEAVADEAVARDEEGAAPAALAACGVGCGGPMDLSAGTVSPLNIPAWREFPLRARLEKLTGLPVGLDNDAKAFALGEGWTGAATGRRDYMAMVVSTGVGGGIVLDGRLLGGNWGNAGHVGHVIVEPDGRLCPCGARGCLEAEASGTAIAAMTGRSPREAGPEVVERTGLMVGRAVASVVSLLDLDLVVVGGSVALGFGSPFFDAANAELRARARLSFAAAAHIVPSALGELGPLVGAGVVGWRAASEAAS